MKLEKINNQSLCIQTRVQKNDSFKFKIILIISIYNFITNLAMEPAKINNQMLSAYIRGRNFYGSVSNKGKQLRLDITQLRKGGIYTCELNDSLLEKEFKRFLIFKNVNDLFDQLTINQNLEVSDQNTLIVPITVIFKGKTFDLKIEVPLTHRKFNNQAERVQNLFQQMEKLNQQRLLITPYPINFIVDKTNQRVSSFQIYDNGKKAKLLATNVHTTLNHFEPLKKKGIFYFKVKIIKSHPTRYIFLGICGNNVKSTINNYMSPLFMGFYLHNGALYGNNKSPTLANGFTIVDGQSIIKIEIDMNKKLITWFHNDCFLCSVQIVKQLVGLDIHPMVNLHNNGDTVQFLNK